MDTSEANLFKYALLSAFRPHGVGPHFHLSRYPPLVLSGHLSGAGPKGPDVSSGKASTWSASGPMLCCGPCLASLGLSLVAQAGVH